MQAPEPSENANPSQESLTDLSLSDLELPRTPPPSCSPRFERLKENVREYYRELGRDDGELLSILESAAKHLNRPGLLDAYEAALNEYAPRQKRLGTPFNGYLLLSRVGHPGVEGIGVEEAHAVGAVLKRLFDAGQPPQIAWRFVHSAKLMLELDRSDTFDLFCKTIALSAPIKGLTSELLDPVTALADAIREADEPLSPKAEELFLRAAAHEVEYGIVPGSVAEMFFWLAERVEAQGADTTVWPAVEQSLARSHEQETSFLGPMLVLSDLKALGRSSEVLDCALRIGEKFQNEAAEQKIAERLTGLEGLNGSPQLWKNFKQAVDEAAPADFQQLNQLLSRITAHAAASTLRGPGLTEFDRGAQMQVLGREAEKARGLAIRSVQELSSHEKVDYHGEALALRLKKWQRLERYFRGLFTEFTLDARRPPSKEPSMLARFGAEVGRVHVVNAKEIRSFPGRGYLISQIDPTRIFVGDPDSPNPLQPYYEAWGRLGKALDEIGSSQFLFTRGMLVVATNDIERYRFSIGREKGEHLALVVFNDHFHNEWCEMPYLVSAQKLMNQLVKPGAPPVVTPYEDFIGFDASRPDINDLIQSPRKMLARIRDEGGTVIPLGDPSVITLGFPEYRLSYDRFVGGNAELRDLEAGRKAALELALRTEQEYEQLGIVNVRSFHRKTRAQLQRLRSQIIHARENRQKITDTIRDQYREARSQDGEHQIWDIADGYRDLLQVFNIGRAYHHKGFTPNSDVDRDPFRPAAERGDPFQSSTSQTPEGRFEEAGESQYNPNSIRLLLECYDWHSAKADGVTDRERFPILTVTRANAHGEMPELSATIDTMTMKATIDGKEYQLSTNGLTNQDEHFWYEQFFPRAADSPGIIRDLVFFLPGQIGRS